MIKDARRQAESIFLDANGKITNVAIAKRVEASHFTVGKWKKEDEWTKKLAAKSEKREEKAGSRPPRKKGAHDQALKLYLEAEGKITNKALASSVGVSKSSIVNWKRSERWAEELMESKKEPFSPATPLEVPVTTSPEPIALEEPVTTPQVAVTGEIEEIEIDVDQLACPDHINRMNKRIDDLLGQEYLSPADLKTLAEAKEAVLGAVSAYIDIVERCSED
jgi:hypothetical protein